MYTDFVRGIAQCLFRVHIYYKYESASLLLQGLLKVYLSLLYESKVVENHQIWALGGLLPLYFVYLIAWSEHYHQIRSLLLCPLSYGGGRRSLYTKTKSPLSSVSSAVDTPPQEGMPHLPIDCIPRTIRAVHLDYSVSKWNGKGTLQ